ncbi:MAG: hypothetical protein WAW52_05415 [Methanothrix sp.]
MISTIPSAESITARQKMANMSTALKIILVFSPLYSPKSKTAQKEDRGPAKKTACFPKGDHFRAEVGPK